MTRRRLSLATGVLYVAAGAVLLLLWIRDPAGGVLSAPSRAAAPRVDAALAENTAVFAALSAVKAVTGVIEGSTLGASLGASFSVEVGDLVQPAYDGIDAVWHVFVWVLFLLAVYRTVFGTGVLTAGAPVAAVGLILLGTARLLRRVPPDGAPDVVVFSPSWPDRTGRALVSAGVLIVLGLPLAVLAADWLSRLYLDPVAAEAASSLGGVSSRLEAFKRQALAGDLKAAAEGVSAVASSLVSSMLRYLAVTILRLLVLPVAAATVFRLSAGRIAGGWRPSLG